MPASVIVEQLTGSSPVVRTSALLGLRFRGDDIPLLDNSAPVPLPAPLARTLNLGSAVTANAAAQTVVISDTSALQVGSNLLISPGTDAQEAVLVTAIPDGTHITAIFGRSHILGVPVQPVTAAVAKVLQFRILSAPSGTVSKIRFYRPKPLPTGVYDQFRFLNTYAQGTDVPWVSNGVNTFSHAPVTAETIIAPGPFVAPGTVTPYVAIQWLFTSAAAGPLDASLYRFSFDES